MVAFRSHGMDARRKPPRALNPTSAHVGSIISNRFICRVDGGFVDTRPLNPKHSGQAAVTKITQTDIREHTHTQTHTHTNTHTHRHGHTHTHTQHSQVHVHGYSTATRISALHFCAWPSDIRLSYLSALIRNVIFP